MDFITFKAIIYAMKILSSLLLISIVSLQTVFCQKLVLKSGTFDSAEYPDLRSVFSLGESPDLGYCLVVFDRIPTQKDRMEMMKQGLHLMDYLPYSAYSAQIVNLNPAFDWESYHIRRVIRFDEDFKLSENLSNDLYPHWTVYGDDQVELNVQYFSNFPTAEIIGYLRLNRVDVISLDEESSLVVVRVSIPQLKSIYSAPFFSYFEEIDPEGEPENLPGRTLHRSNTLWTTSSNGLKYRGDNFRVMMQDDGLVGPHIDFQGRLNQTQCAPCSSSPNDNHGDHVGGTIMGAGNLDPRARGMAHGSELWVYNSSNNNYTVVPNLYQNQDIYITSKSYSNGCNSGYTTLTRSLDQQVRTYTSLIHVFSAGNDGTSDCGYGAGAGFGNITGGHKSGKNVIAVGNLTGISNLANSSSRGPATDGRIKPDICGMGTAVFSTVHGNQYDSYTGTSMSCPGVAGTITQLYEAYNDMHNEIPHAGLMKGIVLNSADDLGNPGPDYRFGWGSINARRAFEIIKDGSFLVDDIEQGQINSHLISVPANVERLRVMIYWSDFEGATNAAVALVNDINMKLVDPSTTEFLPWVLDPTPTVAALNANAVPGIDDLNNVEQITIDHPDAGMYEVLVNGFNIPQGPQTYHVIYYFEQDEIAVTYPIGGEGLNPGSTELIRWDAPEGNSSFTVSFSDDDGASWNVLGTAPAVARFFSWSINQGVLTPQGRIKVERDGVEGISSEAFSVIGTPTGLDVAWSCPDSLKLVWNPVNGALGYEVSMLGNKYMDSLTFTSVSEVVLGYPSSLDTWFSVKSIGENGEIGERAVAINRSPGEFGCVWSAPFTGFSANCQQAGALYCFSLIDESINTDANSDITWYFPGGTPTSSNDPSPQVCYALPGQYDVAMVVNNGVGIDSVYVSAYFDVIPVSYLPYHEGFEYHTNFINNDFWSTESIGGGAARFQITTNVALSGSQSSYLPNFGQPAGGLDELISGPINLSEITDQVTLSFRYAYRKRNADNDEWLRVFLNNDPCQETWTQRRTIRGNTLSPLVSSTQWQPSGPEDWTTVHMTNVTSIFWVENFRVKFQFESDGGNNIFLDDINIYQGAPSNDVIANLTNEEWLEMELFPNPAQDVLNIQFSSSNSELMNVGVLDASGRVLKEFGIHAQSGNNLVMIDVNDFASGVYVVRITQNGKSSLKKLVIQR